MGYNWHLIGSFFVMSRTPSWSHFLLIVAVIFTIVISSLIYVSWRKYKQTQESKNVENDDEFD
ncbi:MULTISPECIES: sporulation protein YpjB [Allobacillus]|uniref:Uncharacterized protein n=1 Tax=Allobacillus salarius TaxID=1955272 RepID=A0A556PT39_9BACI|nr:sporulation protein YpjB [Allobacillus salarius]TSJ67552.1 hypothetical protein FPQ13_00345 [Allobacillus salarius]